MHKIILKPGKEESLLRFHPWVFSGAIARTDDEPQEGDVVDVLTSKGEFIARGHWQIGSIMVRVLTFKADEQIDAAFYVRRLKAALSVRQAIGLASDPTDESGPQPTCPSSPTLCLPAKNDTYRLVHGEGDNLPGLVVDIYARTAVMQAHSPGMHKDRQTIAKALLEVMDGRIDNVYYKSETTLPYKAGLRPENGFLIGHDADDVATEDGLRFHIDRAKGQKTGFFVDQRDNRRLLERYANGRNVLNMFCYTGGFSVYALRGGARLVHSVDSSARAIELTRNNVELNFGNDPRHTAFAEDAFRYLDRMEPIYDLIILDPPAFAKHRDALRNALQGYRKLNAKAFEKVPATGGIVFTFSCSQAVSRQDFRTAVFTAAATSRRNVRILHQLTQPADHPVNIYHPEGEYLKGLVLYIE